MRGEILLGESTKYYGVHESSLPVAYPGYQVLSDILFRLGLIANCSHTVQYLDCSDLTLQSLSPVLALYDPFGVDVPLNCDTTTTTHHTAQPLSSIARKLVSLFPEKLLWSQCMCEIVHCHLSPITLAGARVTGMW